MAEAKAKKVESVEVFAPKFLTLSVRVIGTAPYCQARFSAKAIQAMRDKMLAGSTAKKGGKRAARDFDADYQGAFHRDKAGWVGIPAAAFRNACIDACRMVNYKMTMAKMSVFVESDGFDSVDGVPLVKLIAGEPERLEMVARNATGVCDIRVRPMWREWAANVRMKFDADQFTVDQVTNLLARAGIQVGVGEGRPFSRDSNGLGFGTFRIATADEV